MAETLRSPTASSEGGSGAPPILVRAPDGSLVWTRGPEGLYRLGRLTGSYFYDADGENVDLVHVRPCRWLDPPVDESRCPAAVVATFRRGGRNFQQIHDDRVGEESMRLWGG